MDEEPRSLSPAIEIDIGDVSCAYSSFSFFILFLFFIIIIFFLQFMNL